MSKGINKHTDAATIGACLAVGLVFYILIVIGAYYSQASIIFQTGGLTARPPEAFPIDPVTFETADGIRLNGWWLDTAAPRGTVLYFQGNRQSASEYRRRLRTFTALGVNALIFDYRGYGQSPGRIREEEDIYRDGLAAWSYLCRQRDIAPARLVLWGRSLGGAVAVEVACRREVGALVLESTFNSLADMARHQYGWLPTRHLLRFHFESGAKMGRVQAPLIVIHSPEDRYVPFVQAEKLFHQASSPKVLLKTSGSHLDLFESSPEHWRAFEAPWRRLINSTYNAGH